MNEKRDIPLFRVSSFLICMLGIAAIISNIASISGIIAFVKSPEIKTDISIYYLYLILDGLAIGGPFFIGYILCGFLGFNWRKDFKNANKCLMVGSIISILQVITFVIVIMGVYNNLSLLNSVSNASSKYFIIRTIVPYIPGFVLLVMYFKGCLKMKE